MSAPPWQRPPAVVRTGNLRKTCRCVSAKSLFSCYSLDKSEEDLEGEFEEQPLAGGAVTADEDLTSQELCQNCQAPLSTGSTICRGCGYYATLGTCVELDPSDRKGLDEELEEQPISHLEVWKNMIPRWAWALTACVFSVVGESVSVRVFVPEGDLMRTVWSLVQLAVGMTVFCVAHFICYTKAIIDDSNLSLLDIILRPLKVWAPTTQELPKTLRRVAAGLSGLTAVLMSMLVIGGLNYEKLLDWGIEPQPKKSLVGAIVDQAKKAESDHDNLDEAIDDFAGGNPEEEKKEIKPKAVPMIGVECVILGFKSRHNRPDDFYSLVLGADVNGELKVVGSVSKDIPDDVRDDLNKRMRKILRDSPFVYTSISARWIEPKIVCRIRCLKQLNSGTLVQPKFDRLVTTISF